MVITLTRRWAESKEQLVLWTQSLHCITDDWKHIFTNNFLRQDKAKYPGFTRQKAKCLFLRHLKKKPTSHMKGRNARLPGQVEKLMKKKIQLIYWWVYYILYMLFDNIVLGHLKCICIASAFWITWEKEINENLRWPDKLIQMWMDCYT